MFCYQGIPNIIDKTFIIILLVYCRIYYRTNCHAIFLIFIYFHVWLYLSFE